MITLTCYNIGELKVVSQKQYPEGVTLEEALTDIVCANSAGIWPTRNNSVWQLRGASCVIIEGQVDYLQVLAESSGPLVLTEAEAECVRNALESHGDAGLFDVSDIRCFRDPQQKYALLCVLMAYQEWKEHASVLSKLLTPLPPVDFK